jgi:hypothetical protein
MNWGWGLMLGEHIVLERKQLFKRGRVKHLCISYLFLSLASARQISSASVCSITSARRTDGMVMLLKQELLR